MNPMTYTVASLQAALAIAPATFKILLCDWPEYPGSNWTDKIWLEIDHEHEVVSICGITT